jgi:phosphonate transport system substrate-binding protein
MRRLLALALVGILGLSAVGFAQELGTRDNPITLLLVPSTEAAVVQAAGDAIADALFDLTGLYVEAVMTADYRAFIEAFRTADGDLLGIPTTSQYIEIFAETDGNIEVALASVRRGYTYYFSSVYARRDSGINSLQDLNGKTWIYNDPFSTSGYKTPKVIFDQNGVQVGDTVETGGHSNSMIALLNGQGDFCTGYGSPTQAPDEVKALGIRWEWGDDPELMFWDRFHNTFVREEIRWECVDLRLAVAEDYPNVYEDIGVVAVAGPLANDCIAFAGGFPADLKATLVQALQDHIRSPEGQAIWNDPSFYEWSDMAPITDEYYDVNRALLGYEIPERD